MSRVEATPDLYVLDTLANDTEDLEGILRMLNSDNTSGWHRVWGRLFDRESVVQSLIRLIREGSVQAYELDPDGKSLIALEQTFLPTRSFDDAWFGMTAHGRLRHANWEPESASE